MKSNDPQLFYGLDIPGSLSPFFDANADLLSLLELKELTRSCTLSPDRFNPNPSLAHSWHLKEVNVEDRPISAVPSFRVQ